MPDYTYEKQMGVPLVVGLDEAGCGPWAGPVMAGAALLLPDFPEDLATQLNDSKKLSTLKREKLYTWLLQENGHTCHVAAAEASVEEVDRLNIRQAALLAMTRAMATLPLHPQAALVDGIVAPKLTIPTRCLKKGDQLSLSIAAASIMAKVTRDHLMTALAKEYPLYGWERNAGYGTKMHQEALARHGLTPHHRRSFAPIKALQAAA